jgi:hypothetical protein
MHGQVLIHQKILLTMKIILRETSVYKYCFRSTIILYLMQAKRGAFVLVIINFIEPSPPPLHPPPPFSS